MNFLDLVKKRYSVRSYSRRKVEKEKLNYVLECARLAPSAVNKQPWHFIVIESEEKRKELCQCYHNPWLAGAPVCIVACVDTSAAWTRRYDQKNHADVDASIAIEHICLAAAEQGLGTCWVCAFDPERCRQLLGLNGTSHPVAIIPIGYPESDEQPQAIRKPMEEIVTYL